MEVVNSARSGSHDSDLSLPASPIRSSVFSQMTTSTCLVWSQGSSFISFISCNAHLADGMECAHAPTVHLQRVDSTVSSSPLRYPPIFRETCECFPPPLVAVPPGEHSVLGYGRDGSSDLLDKRLRMSVAEQGVLDVCLRDLMAPRQRKRESD